MAAGFGYTAGPPGSSGGLTRPNSQPAPTQPGFGTQPQQRPLTQSGATALTQPPASGFGQAGGLGALQQFNQQGSFGGFTPQFGGFNPQMQQYRQQMQDWRNQRPEMQPGMDRDAFRQQMDAYRDMRPDRNNMQQPGMPQQMPMQQAPLSGGAMPQYGQYMSQIFANAQGAQGAQPSQELAAPGGATPIADQQAALQNAYQDFLAQKQFGSAIPAGGTPAPSQAVMPQAPNTQQVRPEDPRMQAMRNMQRTRPGFAG